MIMASKVFDLLSDLAKDSKKLSDFKKDPDSVMSKYGLTDDQKTKIKNSMNNKEHDDFFDLIKNEITAHSMAVYTEP